MSTTPCQETVDSVAQIDMAHFCFDVLKAYLDDHDLSNLRPSFRDESYPIFVTWKIGSELRLRGCIGTFSALPLHSGLKEYAITSAVRDDRFSPIQSAELPQLHVSVSLLFNFQPVPHYHDWEFGIHGLKIEFVNEKGQRRSATYLPDYVSTAGSDKDSVIDSLLRKGGYRAPITAHFRQKVKVVRYQSDRVKASYNDYLSYCRQRQACSA